MMRAIVALLCSIIISITSGFAQHGDLKSRGFKRIFTGKNLKGWHSSRTSHQGTTANFFVEDNAIVLQQHPYGQGGVLLTDKKYRNFELYIEVKIDSFCNGGIFLRSTESGQAYQVELAIPGGHCALFGERLAIGRSAQAETIGDVWRAGDWNALRIRMVGEIPKVTLWVNDSMMWEVQQPKNDFVAGAVEGMVGLQSHWTAQYLRTEGGFNMPGGWLPDGAHRFRNIWIREIEEN